MAAAQRGHGRSNVMTSRRLCFPMPPVDAASRDRHIEGAVTRSRKEDLLRTLLCLNISGTARQKPSSDTNKTSTGSVGTASY